MKKSIWADRSNIEKIIATYKDEGLLKCLNESLDYVCGQVLYLSYPIYKNFLPNNNKTFIFNGKKHRYCVDRFNLSWRNERTIEVPIISEMVRENSNKRILEIGCVLKHYFKGSRDDWTTVDLYERQDGVINKDALEYSPKRKYDFIFSISTLEHIGVEDETDEPDKAIKVINHLVDDCLRSGGKFVFTIPLGYNKHLDSAIYENKIKLSKKYFYVRTTKNRWFEVQEEKTVDIPYGNPFIGAGALFIGVIKKR